VVQQLAEVKLLEAPQLQSYRLMQEKAASSTRMQTTAKMIRS
jgi:hypothetical protein